MTATHRICATAHQCSGFELARERLAAQDEIDSDRLNQILGLGPYKARARAREQGTCTECGSRGRHNGACEMGKRP